MVPFRVMDMFSARSIGAITKSVKALDSAATVRIDMQRYRVEIDSGWAHEQSLSDVIATAGFTPQQVASTPQKIAFAGQVDVYLPFE